MEGHGGVTGPTSLSGKKRIRTRSVPVPPTPENHTSTRARKTLMVSALGSGLALFDGLCLEDQQGLNVP